MGQNEVRLAGSSRPGPQRHAGVEIEQVGGVHAASLFELGQGRRGCILPARIDGVAGIFCVLVSIVTLGGGALFLVPLCGPLAINAANPHSMPQDFWVCLFLF